MPRFPNPSSFAKGLSPSVFGELAKKVKQHSGVIYPLNVGDTYLEPPAGAEAHARTGERLHTYSPPVGEPALLDAIFARLSARTPAAPSRANIQVTSGATSGLTVITSTLLEPGDEVLLPSPFWPLIRGIIRARGAKAVEVPVMHRLDEPGFDVAAGFEKAVTPNTVAIYLNSPHNPTGNVLSGAQVDAIADVAERHNLWVITDEAYEELWFTQDRPEPIWAHPRIKPRAISAHTFSKSYGFAGGRIGFVHGPTEIMRAIRGTQTFCTYCASKPMQLGAAQALIHGDAWIENAKAAYLEAAKRAAGTLNLPVPAGGTFLFFDASPHFESGEDIVGFLTRCLSAGVLLTPGGACGEHFQSWARLCFTSIAPAPLGDALASLKPLLK